MGIDMMENHQTFATPAAAPCNLSEGPISRNLDAQRTLLWLSAEGAGERELITTSSLSTPALGWVGAEGASERALVPIPDPVSARALAERVARECNVAVRFGVYREALTLLRSEPCDLVGVDLGQHPEGALAFIRELHERLPPMPILAASADHGLSMMRASLEAGASDFIGLPLSAEELDKVLLKLSHHPVVVNRGATAAIGEIITLCGARGGLGVTTLAVNLAVRLAGLDNGRVALMDLDLQRGDVATFLNLTPTQSLAAAAVQRDVDEMFLYGILTRHASGVFVLAAPSEIEDSDSIGHDDVDMVLRMLRSHFRYTIIDTSRMLTAPTLAAFEQADRILVLTDLSVPGVRAARRTLELLSRVASAAPRVDLLVTDIVSGHVGLAEAVRAIGKDPLFTIPRDDQAASQAMNAGAPLNGARPSRLSVALDELASQLSGVELRPKAKGLLQRIFSNRAAA